MRDERLPDGEGAEMFPAELEPIHLRLEEVGAAWRAELPSSEAFIGRIGTLLGHMAASQPRVPAVGLAERPLPPPAPRTSTFGHIPSRGTMRRGGVRGLAAVGAAIAVVGLFAIVFQLAPTGPGGPRTTAQPGEWSAGAPFRLSEGEVAFVARSDPHVIYRLGTRAITLQRSDDAGATWRTLPLPARVGGAPTPVFAELVVNPHDARSIFLTLFGDQSAPPCATPSSPSAPRGSYPRGVQVTRLAAMPALAGGPNRGCIEQHVSADGGAHWAELTLPDDGLLAEPIFRTEGGPQMPLLAQGGRIYAAMLPKTAPSGVSFSAVRLITSADGVTWHLADDTLARQGKIIEEYVITPTGATIWAATTDRGLWRSEDAGASWARLGALPRATPQQAPQLAAAAGGAALLLYLQTPGAPLGDVAPGDVQASADGGAHWQRAPTAGIPDGQRADPHAAQVRADGAVVMLFRRVEPRIEFSDGISHDAAYYAWKPGAPSWTRLTRQFDAQEIEQQWLAAAASARTGETLWALVYHDDAFTYQGEAYIKDGIYTLMRATLAA